MLLVYLFSEIKIRGINFSLMKRLRTQSILIVLAITLLRISNVSAATINAASCSQSHVQAAINSASNGDTVLVPSGECTWESKASISKKQITVIGAGIGETIITGHSFSISNNQSCRISGFTFIVTGISNALKIIYSKDFRIDHCEFINEGTSSYFGLLYAYGSSSFPLSGLFDNCTFENMRVVHYGEASPPIPAGNTQWSEPLNMGTASAIYFEDNIFKGTNNAYDPAVDTNQGGRYVFRFNMLYNNYLEFHSVQGNNRAGRLFEIYKNTLDMESGYPNYSPMRPRGGTGVIWGNELTGVWNNRKITFDNVRSYEPRAPGGQCDGDSPWDGNEDATGWPCRDQIGRSTDAWLWTSENPYPPQSSAPVYLWLNRDGANIFSASVVNDCGDHIKNNRDFYDEVANFDGSSGAGYGALSNRPQTCTTGVAYWTTDQGDWNEIPGGGQGVLYKCTNTNVWELYYTPYTYPHPLRKPSPPTGLRIVQ